MKLIPVLLVLVMLSNRAFPAISNMTACGKGGYNLHACKDIDRLENDTTPEKTVPRSAHVNLNEVIIHNNLARKLFSYLITGSNSSDQQAVTISADQFQPFNGKTIRSIRFVRLRPFGTSLQDTARLPENWIERSGNKLHMSTSRSKLKMQLQFRTGEQVNPYLLAENEKLMRDLNYLEDVAFQLTTVDERPEEVDLVIVTKDKFEYGVNFSADTDNSNLELVNENMFGWGHRFNIGMAQKNAYLPSMGIYLGYQINNLFGQFINSSVGFTDTYMKKGWNVSAERKFLTSREVNVGGMAFDHVAKYKFIAADHPIELDTTVSYDAGDFWFSHAFTSRHDPLNKTLLSSRYSFQRFDLQKDLSYGESEFLRNHDFFVASLSFARRNLYRNNLVYGYGVTEDIPFGHYHEVSIGLDKSQFGVWPYFGWSLSNAVIGKDGSYFSCRLAMDGFLDRNRIKQGTIAFNGNFFSRKFSSFGDPVRLFVNLEMLGGINRFDEEFLTMDGRLGIRDFHSATTRGENRLKINIETVRYLKWNFYGFRFTHYLYTDLAFLSESMENLFTHYFYTGLGTGFRIFNESLVFKIIDIRLSWFPMVPPSGMHHVGTNLQGLTKSRFDDFLGRKSEVIRFQ